MPVLVLGSGPVGRGLVVACAGAGPLLASLCSPWPLLGTVTPSPHALDLQVRDAMGYGAPTPKNPPPVRQVGAGGKGGSACALVAVMHCGDCRSL